MGARDVRVIDARLTNRKDYAREVLQDVTNSYTGLSIDLRDGHLIPFSPFARSHMEELSTRPNTSTRPGVGHGVFTDYFNCQPQGHCRLFFTHHALLRRSPLHFSVHRPPVSKLEARFYIIAKNASPHAFNIGHIL